MTHKRREFLKNAAVGAIGSAMLNKVISKNKQEDELNMCDPTKKDYYGEGPFYTDQPPLMVDNKLAKDSAEGDRMIISGRILNLECSEFIPDTIVDVWHADHSGAYDNSGYNFRGYTKSNAQGFYLFETIKPGKYPNGNRLRPSHIHFKVKPPGFPLLTTQLYFAGDTSIAEDAAASITSGDFDASNRIIPLSLNTEGILEGQFDIVINGEGIVGTQDIHLDKGMIYKAYPNPISDTVEIEYGVFRRSKVGILVYDLNGKTVAQLEDRMMEPEKYSVTWNPDQTLAKGYYFIVIKINDLQVHYQKVMKL